MNQNACVTVAVLGLLFAWGALEQAEASYIGTARTQSIQELLGPGVQSTSEKWSGLFLVGTPEAPRNVGGLETGMRPDSGSTTALFTKMGGGGYLAGNSIYWQSGIGGLHGPGGGMPPFEDLMNIMSGTVTPEQAEYYLNAGYGLDGEGEFQISSTLDQPVELNSIVFQIRIGGFGPTEEQFADGTYVSSYELTHLFSPVTLTINGTTRIELLDYWNVYFGQLDIGGESQGTYSVDEIWAFQWDLSGYGLIESYTLEFANYPHSSIRGLQVDLVTAIPEPGSVALLAVAAGMFGISRRRRKKNFAIV